jgi:homoserine acetyltransferase
VRRDDRRRPSIRRQASLRPDFPITVADMVRTERAFSTCSARAVAALREDHLGGMQAFEWAILP